MNSVLRVLLLDDIAADRAAVIHALRMEFSRVEVMAVATPAELEAAFHKQGNFDLVLAADYLGGDEELRVLHRIKVRLPNCPVVVYADTRDEKRALAAIQAGVDEFLVKPSADGWLFNYGIRGVLLRAEQRNTLQLAQRGSHGEFSQLKPILGNTPDLILLKDREGRYLFINSAAERTLRLDEKQVIGKTDVELSSSEAAQANMVHERELIESGGVETREQVIAVEGQDRVFLTTKAAYRDDAGVVQGLLVVARDITERKHAEEALRESELRFRLLAKLSPVGIFQTDEHGGWRFMNQRCREICGLSTHDAQGEGWQAAVHPDDREHVVAEWRRAVEQHQQFSLEFRFQHAAGTVTWVLAQAVAEIREPPHLMGYIGTITDITNLKQAESRIRHLAHFDSLTNLPNRHLLLDRLNQELAKARRNDTMLAVMFIDLDRFKVINDTLGHAVGDLLLQAVAERLSRCIRQADTVSRQGGDEFVVVLPDISHAQDAAQVAQKFLQALAEPFLLGGHELHVTPSIGISLYPDDGTDADTLMKNADSAMYRVKERGKNHYQFYTADMTASSLERLGLENRLRKALERGEFMMHYQPQIDLATGNIVGVEALLRWQHPERGLLASQDFIGIAEETGLIVQIGEWALEQACIQGSVWSKSGMQGLRMVVNFSARQFRQHNMVSRVEQILSRTGFSPEFLELEISESILMHNALSIVESLRRLQEIGVRLSVDDFGIGYFSLSYLRRFPINKLKIGQALVRDILSDENDAEVIESVIALGHSLRLRVIAAGVENAQQLAFLQSRRCDEAQGYYFSPTLSAEDTEIMLRQMPALLGQASLPL
ncbi:MAG: EAL domain-containing protein [Pseudomonadota bacterium]